MATTPKPPPDLRNMCGGRRPKELAHSVHLSSRNFFDEHAGMADQVAVAVAELRSIQKLPQRWVVTDFGGRAESILPRLIDAGKKARPAVESLAMVVKEIAQQWGRVTDPAKAYTLSARFNQTRKDVLAVALDVSNAIADAHQLLAEVSARLAQEPAGS